MASQIAKNKLWELTKANFTYTTLNYTLDYHEKFSYSNLFTKEKQILSLNFSITVSLSTRSPFANETHTARARDNEHPHKGCLHTMFHFPKWSHFIWTASEICNLPHFVLGYSCFSLLHFFFKKWFYFWLWWRTNRSWSTSDSRCFRNTNTVWNRDVGWKPLHNLSCRVHCFNCCN